MQSINYPPSPDLRDVIARHYVFSVALPDDYELVDSLLAETAFIRILRKGDWAAEMAPGDWRTAGRTLFFGPNSKPLKVRCRGSFDVVGVALRPGGWPLLSNAPVNLFTDQMRDLSELWGDRADLLHAEIREAGDDMDAVIVAIEREFRSIIADVGGELDSHMVAFERIARDDSTVRVAEAAAAVGLSERQFERHCVASFGMSPKRVLRRSRFLDMASVMRGHSQPDEGELAALRFFDHSHRNREFREFIGMTPGTFTRTATPLLDAGLELRTQRKHGPDFF